ncbi:MAG: hypothetical protein ACFE75_08450 [Candidatus Hodarchaeota archaeon]
MKKQVIFCNPEWDDKEIKELIQGTCAQFMGGLPIVELENNILEGSGQLNLGPDKKDSYLQRKAPELKGTFQIGVDPTKGKYLEIEYEIGKGTYKKTLSKSYWEGLHKGLKSVLEKPLSSFQK